MIDDRKEAGGEFTKEAFLQMSAEIQKDDAVRIMKKAKEEGTESSLNELYRRANEEADGVSKKPWWRAVF